MRQDRKQKDKPAAALALCFCLMALVSVFAVKSNIDKVNDNMGGAESSEVVKKEAVDDIEDVVEKDVDEEDVAEETETSMDIVDSRENTEDAEASSEYIMPVEGEIIMEHSTDMPIYWQTLDQYMTHSGIDIASAVGTPVQACAAGTVTKIEENDKMGVTVEINHSNGLISVYSNLAADGLIELGEIVKQGTVIGKVGQSSMFEFESLEHLHFEMRLDDAPANPMDYLTIL